MVKEIEYEGLEEAGFAMIPRFVESLYENLEMEQPALLDIKDLVNHYFALFVLYHESMARYFDKNPDIEFHKKFTLMIFFTFYFSIYQSLISLIILRFSNQIDASILVLRSIIEKCALAQHLILHPSEYPKWKKGKQIILTGKEGVITNLLNQNYIQLHTGQIQDIDLGENGSNKFQYLYKEFSDVVHNRISELGDIQNAWIKAKHLEKALPMIDKFYINSATQFFRFFPLMMDIVTLTMTYNAFLITHSSLFDLSSHRDKINELLNVFPNTKIIFKNKLM